MSTDQTAAFWSTECTVLRARIDARAEHIARVRAHLDELEHQHEGDVRRLEEIEGLLELRPQLRLETLSRRLRGERLCEVAVALLERELGVGQPVHYRDWYALVREAGHEVGGRDPPASFLTQVTRHPKVERIPDHRGVYRLRPHTRVG